MQEEGREGTERVGARGVQGAAKGAGAGAAEGWGAAAVVKATGAEVGWAAHKMHCRCSPHQSSLSHIRSYPGMRRWSRVGYRSLGTTP